MPDIAEGNGWKLEDGSLQAIMTDILPAPDFSIELNSCKCKKTNCKNNQCSCKKLKLTCTEACLCLNCENQDSTFEHID